MAAVVERVGYAPAPARAGRFRALVVSGDPVRRDHLVRRLVSLGAEEVSEAASVDEAQVRAGAGPWELLVVDAALPDGSGASLCRDLRRRGWQHSLVLSSGEDPYAVRGALSAGVRAFLVEPGPATSPAVDPRSAQTSRTRTMTIGIATLSRREAEVLQLVADGRSNRDVGIELSLSPLTVKSHLARIARKVGTGDRAEMVALALRAGVIV